MKNTPTADRLGKRIAAVKMAQYGAVVLALAAGSVEAQETPPPPPPQQETPLSTPPPTPPSSPTAPVESPPEPARADLPEAKQILDESVAVLGVPDKAKELSSFAAKAQVNDPSRGELLLMVKSIPNGAFHLIQSIANVAESEMTVVFDGQSCWIQLPSGDYEVIRQPMLAQGQREFDMLFPYWLLYHPQQSFKSAQTVDRTQFNEIDCYKVRLTRDGDDQLERFGYFAVEKKLIQGFEIVQPSPDGPVALNFVFDEWKEIDGRQVFGKMTVSREGVPDVEVRYSEIEFNKVDPAILEQPEEVKAKIKAQAEAAASAPETPDQPPPGDAPPTQPPAPPEPDPKEPETGS